MSDEQSIGFASSVGHMSNTYSPTCDCVLNGRPVVIVMNGEVACGFCYELWEPVEVEKE